MYVCCVMELVFFFFFLLVVLFVNDVEFGIYLILILIQDNKFTVVREMSGRVLVFCLCD